MTCFKSKLNKKQESILKWLVQIYVYTHPFLSQKDSGTSLKKFWANAETIQLTKSVK